MLISTAHAQAAGGAAGGSDIFVQLMPLVLIFVVFYFLLIRPQQQRAKQHRAMVDALKKGDQVVTAGGLIGRVLKVDEHYVDLELGTNVRVKAVKSTIGDIVPPTGAAPAND